MQVRRIVLEPTDTVGALPSAGYAGGFEFSDPAPGLRSPEQWARAGWEQAPRLVRGFLRFAWRAGLGLRMGPKDSPTHVLGWALVSSTEQAAVLEARSWLLTARNVVELRGTRVRWTTFVRFDRRPAAALWSLAVPVHHALMSRLLRRAAQDG
ncbi:hypothetical protein CU254_25500 [Amycolatopsis sp. AA4]|nr:hypothetical protein CU254_25500 [Amycolatopsis sp. AA4]EFL09348.1 predicted protein [Streptomyces sp. AA4]